MRINLASNQLALALIAVLVLFLTLSAVIPQRDVSEDQILDWQEFLGSNYVFIEKLGLDRIYHTPPFFVVLGLLAVNLLFGSIQRFRHIYRIEDTALKVRRVGSILFHLSLLLIMVAVILNYLYRYHGVLAITEGQTLSDVPGAYHREFKGPLYADIAERFSVRLDGVTALDSSIMAPGQAARINVAILGEAATAALVSSNHPFAAGGLEFHYGVKSGYSPEIQLIDSAGNDMFRSFVRLANRKIEGRIVHRDYAFIHDEEIKIEVEIIAGQDSAVILYEVMIHRDTTTLYDGVIAMNETAQFDGYQFSIPRLRRWCYINVVISPYLDLVFLGFWLAVSGLAISFVSRLKKQWRA